MKDTVKFLQDEVRSGFYIPTAIKQAWAVQLDVLSVIDKICKKYNITYFADWGTLLGAVRHGGYVPWDDDLDICMKRDDYNKFKSVVESELPEGFAFHNYENKEGHWLFLSRVVNTNSICFSEDFLNRNYNFPYIASVDIFILDYLYNDEFEERKRCEEIKYILAVAEGLIDGKYSVNAILNQLRELENKYGIEFKHKCDNEKHKLCIELYQLVEKQMERVDKEDTDWLGQIFPWILGGFRSIKKEYYERSVILPFENVKIPVPYKYNKAMSSRFRNYMVVNKTVGGHDYPYFEGQKDNLAMVGDIKGLDFSIDRIEKLNNVEKKDSLKDICEECLDEINVYIQKLENEYDNSETITVLLCELQQFVIDLGTLIEQVKGEEYSSCKRVVKSMEDFCETVYNCYDSLIIEKKLIKDDVISKIQSSFVFLKKQVEENIVNRKEILFVSTGYEFWDSFSGIYAELILEDEYDVYVVVVPTMRKDIYGNIMEVKDIESDMEMFEKQNIVTFKWDLFNLEMHQPDIVFIQNPYDGENPCLTIPSTFYSKNIKLYTNKLIYKSPLAGVEISDEDERAIYNLKHYVFAPALFYADSIIVSSERMKELYIRTLLNYAGGSMCENWDQKIVIIPDKEDTKQDIKKKLMFCVCLSEIIENTDTIVSEISNSLDMLKKYDSDVVIKVQLYPENEDIWEENNYEIYHEILSVIKKYDCFEIICKNEDRQKRYSDVVKEFDAYYGGASPIAHEFKAANKDVMIIHYGE